MERLCQRYLRAAARLVRRVGLARGWRMDPEGQVCMLGALDSCGVVVPAETRAEIERHIVSVLPPIQSAVFDDHNGPVTPTSRDPAKIAYWSNMVAKDAREVGDMLEKAAERC